MKKISKALATGLVLLAVAIRPVEVHAEETVKIPKNVVISCDRWGAYYGICSELLQSICWEESRCNPLAENGNCKGICQINVSYQQDRMERLKITDPLNIDQNIRLCADILSEHFGEDEDLYLVLMKYNCGSSKGQELFDKGVYTLYAKNVAKRSELLERKNGK